MSCAGHYLRSSLLGLALLLAGLASFVSLSYDADEQDSIPPVTVELKFVVRASACAHGSQLGSTVAVDHNIRSARSRMAVEVTLNDVQTNRGFLSSSPQRLLPLLC